jgi:hypothetical protein
METHADVITKPLPRTKMRQWHPLRTYFYAHSRVETFTGSFLGWELMIPAPLFAMSGE